MFHHQLPSSTKEAQFWLVTYTGISSLKRIEGLKVDPHHLHPRIIYNSIIRSTFCGVVKASVGDLGGGKGPSAGFPPLLRLFCFWVSVLPGFTLVVRGEFKPKAVSGWGKEITLGNCYLFHSALEKKVTCFSQPLRVWITIRVHILFQKSCHLSKRRGE